MMILIRHSEELLRLNLGSLALAPVPELLRAHDYSGKFSDRGAQGDPPPLLLEERAQRVRQAK
jgi:hypothetical protein